MGFKVGDIVICIKKYYPQNTNILNLTGKIIRIPDARIGGIEIEFDKYMGGHNGRECIGKIGHCWWFDKYELNMFKLLKTNSK